ncbi:Na+/H+ antiporter subunit E [Salinibacterium sp. TMP30]|uniref:Na+/H+ antiporter subunit E n=1 Tax=Salinibacterium sp. TMP30 TaxID=3138237 RepID=UPI00313A1FAF
MTDSAPTNPGNRPDGSDTRGIEPPETSDPLTRRELRWRIWQQLPLIFLLVALWMLLWGTVSVLSVTSGVAIALAVTSALYLPPVQLSGRFNPFWFTVYLIRFLGALVAGSVNVAWQAFSPKGVKGNSIIAVQLVTRSDIIMALTAISVTLIPGSLVLEVDRQNSVLYLHALNTTDEVAVNALRRSVHSFERSLVRALGSPEDVANCRMLASRYDERAPSSRMSNEREDRPR